MDAVILLSGEHNKQKACCDHYLFISDHRYSELYTVQQKLRIADQKPDLRIRYGLRHKRSPDKPVGYYRNNRFDSTSYIQIRPDSFHYPDRQPYSNNFPFPV